jgi:hypothetical protein
MTLDALSRLWLRAILLLLGEKAGLRGEPDRTQGLKLLFHDFHAELGKGCRVFLVGRPHPGPLPEGEGVA